MDQSTEIAERVASGLACGTITGVGRLITRGLNAIPGLRSRPAATDAPAGPADVPSLPPPCATCSRVADESGESAEGEEVQLTASGNAQFFAGLTVGAVVGGLVVWAVVSPHTLQAACGSLARAA